jgi:nucleotide-binding universal stress UspA family protein
MAADQDQKRIVVGIDGSEPSRRALRWAVDEARLRGAALTLVYAWPAPYYVPGPNVQIDPEFDQNEPAVDLELANGLVEDELERLGDLVAGIPIDRRVGQGQPVPMLLDAAEGAEMLVVGSRGRGGFKSLVLGSVSQQCILHATCPVVVMRP